MISFYIAIIITTTSTIIVITARQKTGFPQKIVISSPFAPKIAGRLGDVDEDEIFLKKEK